MRRSMNGTRSNASNASPASSKQTGGAMTRRSTLTEEQNGKGERPSSASGGGPDVGQGAGPLTARMKMLEKKFSQFLEMQAKFNIMDKWLQQQFGVKLFPSGAVNMEKFADGDPEDAENPFYAVYLVIQKMKFLEERVKKLESRPFDDVPEMKPTSNYSSAHAFRNLRGGRTGGGVKRSYQSSAPTTPKKAKVMPRPVQPSSNYPFKPSVKILPKDPNVVTPIKKEKDAEIAKDSTPIKFKEELELSDIKQEPIDDETKEASANEGKNISSGSTNAVTENTDTNNTTKANDGSNEGESDIKVEAEAVVDDAEENKQLGEQQDEKPTETEAQAPESSADEAPEIIAEELSQPIKDEADDDVDRINMGTPDDATSADEIPVLEDATAMDDDGMEVGSDQDDADMDVEQKPDVQLMEEELGGGDVSGSEASVSSLASLSSKPRLSTRRQAAAAAAASASGKSTEEEKPVMYTTRGRRHTVPRRYAEFTGHDNVVSILKSQQRAEKSAAASSSKAGRRQTVAPSKSQDTLPPKMKKMAKNAKTPSPKKSALLNIDSDDGEPGPSPATKKKSHSGSHQRPACVDALVNRVMAREVDSDGMVVLSESYPNIFVNQQQLITVVVRSNGKSTRLTRKMTTLVFEDSVLASASPFGTKYYKDRLPPEPLEAMVDFIAESGFEPHYSKKKIYMIVGQVCNEARAGRVSKKFVTPMEAGASGSQQSLNSEESESPDMLSPSETPQSSQNVPQ